MTIVYTLKSTDRKEVIEVIMELESRVSYEKKICLRRPAASYPVWAIHNVTAFAAWRIDFSNRKGVGWNIKRTVYLPWARLPIK